MQFRHPFARFGGGSRFGGAPQQIIGGFTIEGDVPASGGGKSRHIKVTLDSDLISELEIRQVNDKSVNGNKGTILNEETWTDGVSMVRRTGPKTWEFRTLTTQGEATGIGLAMNHYIFRVYDPDHNVVWEKDYGHVMTASEVANPSSSMLPANVAARGGWSAGDVRPHRHGSSGTREINTGMTAELLASVMPPLTTTEMDDKQAEEEEAARLAAEEEAENLTTTIIAGTGIGASILVLVYSFFRLFGKKGK